MTKSAQHGSSCLSTHPLLIAQWSAFFRGRLLCRQQCGNSAPDSIMICRATSWIFLVRWYIVLWQNENDITIMGQISFISVQILNSHNHWWIKNGSKQKILMRALWYKCTVKWCSCLYNVQSVCRITDWVSLCFDFAIEKWIIGSPIIHFHSPHKSTV